MEEKNLSLEEYQDLYEKFIDYNHKVHQENQKRIRVGLWVNILLPIVFLVISFISHSSRLVWLVLWVVSLFGIAFYLMYVEYTDFEMLRRLKAYGVELSDNDSLMEDSYSKELARASERMQAVENRQKEVSQKREAVRDELKDLQKGVKNKTAEAKEELKEGIKKKRDKKEDKDEDSL